MTSIVELPPDVENRLRERAERQGVPVSRVAAEALALIARDWDVESIEDDAADLAEAERISSKSDPAKRRSLAELKQALGRNYGTPRSRSRANSHRIEELELNPRPSGVVRLQGKRDYYRIRSGDYRVIYRIEDDVLVVLVVTVGHRRDVYR